MSVAHDPTGNHLLAALAPEERERIFPPRDRSVRHRTELRRQVLANGGFKARVLHFIGH